jgi:hypothetical protein
LVFYALEDDRIIESSDVRFSIDSIALDDKLLADRGPIGTILDAADFTRELDDVMVKIGADIDAIDDVLAIRRWRAEHAHQWTVYQLERELPGGEPDRRYQVRTTSHLAFYRLHRASDDPQPGQEAFHLAEIFGGFDGDYPPYLSVRPREEVLALLPRIREDFGIRAGELGHEAYQRLELWLKSTLEPFIGFQEEVIA